MKYYQLTYMTAKKREYYLELIIYDNLDRETLQKIRSSIVGVVY